MGNAVWLFFALPEWYFSSILQPFGAGILTAVPAVGILALAVGIAWGVAKRRLGLAIFLTLPAASQALVVVAGLLRGKVHNSDMMLWMFLLLQAIAAGCFVFRLKSARIPASALTVFALSYAFFASFVASMSFSDMWL